MMIVERFNFKITNHLKTIFKYNNYHVDYFTKNEIITSSINTIFIVITMDQNFNESLAKILYINGYVKYEQYNHQKTYDLYKIY